MKVDIGQRDKTIEELIVALYAKILEYQLFVTTFVEKSTARIFLESLIGENAHSQLLDEVKKQDLRCRNHLGIEGVVNGRECLSILTDSRTVLERVDNRIDSIFDILSSERNLQILNWISPESESFPSPGSTHATIFGTAKLDQSYAHSGRWLFAHPSYLRWVSSDAWWNRVSHYRQDIHSTSWSLCEDTSVQCKYMSATPQCLWVRGPVGTGKTVVTARAVEETIKRSYERDDEQVAFFYCSQSRGVSGDPETILRSLVRQLSYSKDGSGIAQCVQDTYKEYERTKSRIFLICRQCVDLLEKLIAPFNMVTLFVDALDELGKSEHTSTNEAKTPELIRVLAEHLYELSRRAGSKLRLFVSSRDHVNVEVPFQYSKDHFDALKVTTEVRYTRSDLKTYIDTEGARRSFMHPGIFDYSDATPEQECRKQIISVLTERSEGMYV